MLKLLFNDLADFITASQKVSPKKLIDAGYQFSFPGLEQALENIIA
jgi:NAD dependent epimerase/dehydratase family enzyme